MSWWDSSGFSSFANQAIKVAQKRIDKVLDIKEEEAGRSSPTSSTISSTHSESSTTAQTPLDDVISNPQDSLDGGGEFWKTWHASESSSSSEAMGFLGSAASSLQGPKSGQGTVATPHMAGASTTSSESMSASPTNEGFDADLQAKIKTVRSSLERKSISMTREVKTVSKMAGSPQGPPEGDAVLAQTASDLSVMSSVMALSPTCSQDGGDSGLTKDVCIDKETATDLKMHLETEQRSSTSAQISKKSSPLKLGSSRERIQSATDDDKGKVRVNTEPSGMHGQAADGASVAVPADEYSVKTEEAKQMEAQIEEFFQTELVPKVVADTAGNMDVLSPPAALGTSDDQQTDDACPDSDNSVSREQSDQLGLNTEQGVPCEDEGSSKDDESPLTLSLTMASQESFVMDCQQSDWGDVSLSILTESQISTGSETKDSTRPDHAKNPKHMEFQLGDDPGDTVPDGEIEGSPGSEGLEAGYTPTSVEADTGDPQASMDSVEESSDEPQSRSEETSVVLACSSTCDEYVAPADESQAPACVDFEGPAAGDAEESQTEARLECEEVLDISSSAGADVTEVERSAETQEETDRISSAGTGDDDQGPTADIHVFHSSTEAKEEEDEVTSSGKSPSVGESGVDSDGVIEGDGGEECRTEGLHLSGAIVEDAVDVLQMSGSIVEDSVPVEDFQITEVSGSIAEGAVEHAAEEEFPTMDSSTAGSTDTQDELSESNKTLTADEFEQPASAELDQSDADVGDISRPEDEAVTGGETESAHGKMAQQQKDVQQHQLTELVIDTNLPDAVAAGAPTTEHKEDVVEEKSSDDDSPRGVTSPGSSSSGSSNSAHGNNLTSSNYVKNMLEEAMTESVKDTDSHADSHSSSDMVRIESSQNSGHTSADEIDTTASSDIEIISHISTPTPNGSDYKADRPFDLSPLRHALSRSVRRGSPPGHKRSDSSSSGTSYHSRNGEDLLSPDSSRGEMHGAEGGRHRHEHGKSTEQTEGLQNPLDTDRLLKDFPNLDNPSLQPICENLENSSHSKSDDDSITVTESNFSDLASSDKQVSDVTMVMASDECIDTKFLAKRLAEMAEVLDAREKKLVDLSRENMDLIETNNILRNQLHQSEEAREAELTDLNILTEEFAKRIGEAEKKLSSAVREKDGLKKKLQDTESELVKRAENTGAEMILKEREQQIAELLEEGQKLSKQQLQSNNIIKKLRVKEKENESLIKSHKQKAEEQKVEIDKLQKILDGKMDTEKKQVDAINQLNSAVKSQEEEIHRLKSELEDSVEKTRSMQVGLDNSYKEIAELHRANAARRSEAQEAALSSEIQAKDELQRNLERYQHQARQDQETLLTQIEDLQLSVSRMEREHGRREDVLRQEISDLQQRLQEAEERNQELTQSVTAATRPLLRQIENLQATYTAQSFSYEKVEKNLTDRLSEAQSQLAGAVEKERAAVERLIDLESRLTALESQNSQLRQEKSRNTAQLEMEKSKVNILEDTRNNEAARMEAMHINFEQEVSSLKREKLLLEHQLEMEKMRVESEKKKVLLVHEQLHDKEVQLQTRSSPSYSREGSVSGDSLMTVSQQEDVLEKTLMIASSNGNRTSLYESLRHSGATALVENLQSQLKMREGEIVQLQSDISELERTRESMARELVNLTNARTELEEKLEEYPHFQKQHQDLNQRYSALLQMYGEKVEEANELRLDLQDVKDMYKSQIDELLKHH